MKTLVLVRHGESEWNAEGRFTGWTDVNLTEAGRAEARRAGEMLRDSGLDFRLAYTSLLTRSIETLHIIELAMGRSWIANYKDWRLNEKHYGILQGWSKEQTAREFGSAQVHRWRRAYDCAPPPLEDGDVRLSDTDPRYAGMARGKVPRTESLRDTCARVQDCWLQQLAPALQERPTLLVVAHGNSLRALMMSLQDLTPEEVERLEIPTGLPLLVELDADLRYTSARYLGMTCAESGFTQY